jgi:hypothetical protein
MSSLDWASIDKKYSNSQVSFEWENFKKDYYLLESKVKNSIDKLQKFHLEISKKLTFFE